MEKTSTYEGEMVKALQQNQFYKYLDMNNHLGIHHQRTEDIVKWDSFYGDNSF